MITLWPVLAPLSHGLGIIEGSRSALKKRQIMQRLEKILLPCVTAQVASQQRGSIQEFNVKRVCFHNDIFSRSIDWHGVAIGFVGDQTVAVEPGLGGDTTIVSKRRQAA